MRVGLDPSVLNQPVIVNDVSLTIVGVAARGFEGTSLLPARRASRIAPMVARRDE